MNWTQPVNELPSKELFISITFSGWPNWALVRPHIQWREKQSLYQLWRPQSLPTAFQPNGPAFYTAEAMSRSSVFVPWTGAWHSIYVCCINRCRKPAWTSLCCCYCPPLGLSFLSATRCTFFPWLINVAFRAERLDKIQSPHSDTLAGLHTWLQPSPQASLPFPRSRMAGH